MQKQEEHRDKIRKRIEELDIQIQLSEFERDVWKGILEDRSTKQTEPLKAESIEVYKKIYENYRETIEHWLRFGNDFEKEEAIYIKKVALGEIK